MGVLAATAAGQEFLARWLPSASSLRGAPSSSGMANMAGMHHGAPPAEPSALYTPQFFNPEEFKTVEVLTEMIIPAGDKPGAQEARVADYIDFVVFSAAEFQPSLQEDWAHGLAMLNQQSKKKYGAGFNSMSPAHREQLLIEMSLPERDRTAQHPGYDFYRLVKEMTVEGFFTSRAGLVDFLEYQGLTYLREFPGCTHPEHQS